MSDKKKMAAALAAVTNYIKSTEEATAQAQAMAQAPAVQQENRGGTGNLNLWGLNGRGYMMQIRTLMQLRTFNKQRF